MEQLGSLAKIWRGEGKEVESLGVVHTKNKCWQSYLSCAESLFLILSLLRHQPIAL